MKFKAVLKPLVAAMCGLLTVAQGANPDRLGGYDFSYQVHGDARVRPVQVFDDGRSTFFQFRSGEPVPAIFAETQQGPSLVMPELEGPYVKVASLSGAFVLRMGYGVGRVAYTSSGRSHGAIENVEQPPRTEPPAPAGMARLLATSQIINGLPADMLRAPPRPSLETNSYATPLRGDLTEWTEHPDTFKDHAFSFGVGATKLNGQIAKSVKSIAALAGNASRVEVLGRDDPSHKEGIAEARAATIVGALTAAGVPRNIISWKTTAEVKDASKASVEGATVRVYESAPKAPVVDWQQQAGDSQLAAILQGIRSGSISAAQAIAMVEQSRTAGAVQVAAKPAAAIWTVRATDESIQKMLERWANAAGWKVVWRNAPAIRITGDSELSKVDFLQAADIVISQSKTAGYRIQARAFSNQVLLIEGSTQ